MSNNIKMVCALDENGFFIGNYSVDAETMEIPGVNYHSLVEMPTVAQPTGKYYIYYLDPSDPNSETIESEIIDWPTVGWRYLNNTWIAPEEEII